MSSINLQENQLSGCETYIAIVVDESGSIDDNEAQQIKSGLTSFINSQTQSNITLSLIGMSPNDANSRLDHIIEKRISSNSSEFLTWINAFRSRSVNLQSDYWASGLEAVNNLPTTPDIIIVITDGLQITDRNKLKNLFNVLNLKSHVFTYGVSSNVYMAASYTNLTSALTYYLEKSPLVKSSTNTILNSDYIELPNFTTLNSELNQLTSDLAAANIGCMANVDILENKIIYPVLKAGTYINTDAGSLVLKNKSRVPLTLDTDTKIHSDITVEGLSFMIKNAVTVAPGSELEVPLYVKGTPANSGSFSKLIAISNVNNTSQFKLNLNIENRSSTCETYIAIVVDESGSISTDEAQQIREGLTSFIDAQAQSKITLSLIGMSNSDTAVRPDDVIQKKIAVNSQDFKDWINLFGNGRVSVQSDYWASGLNVVKNLTVTPDIVFLITDGLQVNNSEFLKGLFTDLNERSKVFVYGATSSIETAEELTVPLNTFLGRTPIVKENTSTALNSDYIRVIDFNTLGNELNQLATNLSDSQIGCISNVSIVQDKISYPVLKKGIAVNQPAGTLVLKNKSRVPLSFSSGIKIHSVGNLNGLVFKLQNAVTIPGSSQIEVAIKIEGKPLNTGTFSTPIFLDNVNNPLDFSIHFNVVRESPTVEIVSGKTNLQSTYLQIAAAGSRGVDSTRGIHLRWMLAGKLGENHLPKGTLYTGETSNFNKTDDFVKVYRAPYTKVNYTLNLNAQPQLVDNDNTLWIYKTADSKRAIYVHFRNKEKYAAIKLSINPRTNPSAFIQAYGNNLIEIENKNELFFAAELNFTSVTDYSALKLETLSVSENKITASKRVTNRKTYSSTQLNNIRLIAENGRSIRLKANNCLLNSVNFEFYSDFITKANTDGDWTLKGKYALDNNDLKVFEQLEPRINTVHGKWLRYNDGEYVNIANYKDKWNRTTNIQDKNDKNIKQIVEKYIELSEKSFNPTALEPVNFGDLDADKTPEEIEEQQLDDENLNTISNLDLLNIAANDYHIARMLGLGCIDIDNEVFSGDYIYLTEYTTLGDLGDGLGAREVQHLSMSIPTSLNTERYSLPVQLNKIVPGLNVNSDENHNTPITDPDGYSFDGKKRYVSLFMEDVMDYDISKDKNDFFKSSFEYDGSSFTFPVYLGVDSKLEKDSGWKKPKLSHDLEYKNVTKNLTEADYETVPIIIPESGKSILNVRQEEVGKNTYIYQGYGINIFSRASTGRQISIESEIKPANNLMPPANINALLITEENPLMFTSESEQIRLSNITGDDKSLVRILFDYYSAQELISYTVPEGMSINEARNVNSIYPDSEEILADHFKLFYKDGLPEVEYGEIGEIDNLSDILTATITIKEYTVLSSGEEVKISLTEENKKRFTGGILTIGDENYLIQDIEVFTKPGDSNKFDYAKIKVLKKEVSDSAHADGEATIDSDQIKPIEIPESKLCTLVQNMQTACNWHKPGIDFKVEYPAELNEIYREVIQPESENSSDLQVEKTRGIWEDAVIERVLEETFEMNADGSYKVNTEGAPIKWENQKRHLGLYKITFPGYNLSQHPQFKSGNENSVEWFNGIVRLFTKSSFKEGSTIPVKSRKEFKVVRTEKENVTGNLVLIVNDTDFKLGDFVNQVMDENYDEIIVGSRMVNYYPSYRVYLYADQASGITKENIQPRANESTHYSIFGISSCAVRPTFEYKSKISIPCPMYAVKIEKPERPEKIENDSLYATRPDFYNRSTFTFTTTYNSERKPYGALHYRASEQDFLNLLYEPATVKTIREELRKLGGNDEIQFKARWDDFLNFNGLAVRGHYEAFPENQPEVSYQFPMPNNKEFIKLINDFIKWHNAAQTLPEMKEPEIESITSLNKAIISKGVETPVLAIHFIEEAIQSAFVPLTEVPVVYEYIKGSDYVPTNKKQTIKDKNGHTLKPTDSDFDIAPMMKIVNESENKTQFTDFNLDGNSQNVYFYAVREMDIKMNFSPFSDFLGPVKLVASSPPQTPEIKRIMPILENQVLGIKPSIQFEINAYQPEYKIGKINIYRADSMLNAQSIRTMTLAKEILIDESTLSSEFDNVWNVNDDFEDLESIPFGDGLFYRITVSRKIEYADPDSTDITVDYAPSQPSKITATVIVDTVSPESPVLEASANVTGTNEEVLESVTFNWEKTVHNGKYHVYKMNSQGNWEKIQEKVSNDENIVLPLAETKQATDELVIKNENNDRIYHHFKVLSENSSGMFSSEEKILTL